MNTIETGARGLELVTPATDSRPDSPSGASTAKFADDLAQALDGVRGTLANADGRAVDALTGSGDLHQAMLALTKAEISLHFVTQVRNKLIDAYREIMRTNI